MISAKWSAPKVSASHHQLSFWAHLYKCPIKRRFFILLSGKVKSFPTWSPRGASLFPHVNILHIPLRESRRIPFDPTLLHTLPHALHMFSMCSLYYFSTLLSPCSLLAHSKYMTHFYLPNTIQIIIHSQTTLSLYQGMRPILSHRLLMKSLTRTTSKHGSLE